MAASPRWVRPDECGVRVGNGVWAKSVALTPALSQRERGLSVPSGCPVRSVSLIADKVRSYAPGKHNP
ncbi:hypothetical protein Pssp01_32290 [Pseudomonas sp. NBRC 100443]|nr:hypothetical protein Pssp01_32290 [Pseudomonas sp. NBRC 100443]